MIKIDLGPPVTATYYGDRATPPVPQEDWTYRFKSVNELPPKTKELMFHLTLTPDDSPWEKGVGRRVFNGYHLDAEGLLEEFSRHDVGK